MIEIEQTWTKIFGVPTFCFIQDKYFLCALLQTDNKDLDQFWTKARQQMSPKIIPLKLYLFKSLPLTPNGKIDRSKFKELINGYNPDVYQAQNLEHHWFRLTGIRPSNHSNFVQDGGDSYTAVLLAEHLNSNDSSEIISKILHGKFQDLKVLELSMTRKNEVTHQNQLSDAIAQNNESEVTHQNKSDDVMNEIFSQKWKGDLEKCIDASPILDKGLVIIGSHKGLLAAYDFQSQCWKWKVQLGDRIEATVATDGTAVYVGTYGKAFYKINLDSGDILWINRDANDIIKAKACIVTDKVIFASYDGQIRCVACTDGQMCWQTSIGSPVLTPLRTDDNYLYCTSLSGKFYKICVSNGQTEWVKCLDSPIFSSFELMREDKVIFVVSVKGLLYKINIVNGESEWKVDNLGHIFSPISLLSFEFPAEVENQNQKQSGSLSQLIIASKEGVVTSVDPKQGTIIWSIQTDNGINAKVLKVKQYVLIIDTSSNYIFVDSYAGAVKKKGNLGIGPTFASALIPNDEKNMFLGSRDNFLYHFQLQLPSI